MCNTPDLQHSASGTQFEYYLLSTFGYGSALTRYPKHAVTLHYCCPDCPGCESPELWMWRTVVDSRTLESDGVCPRCLDMLLQQAALWRVPALQSKAWDD